MRIVEYLCSASVSGDHQTVPRSDDFIVEVRAWPPAADGKQFLAALRERFANLPFGFLKMPTGVYYGVAFDQNVFAPEFIVRIASFWSVAVRLHTVMEIKNLSRIAECIVDFFFCPDVERAFGSFPMAGIADPGYNRAVSIFGGEEAALLRCHIASDIIEDVARNGFKSRISCDLERVEVGDCELRLIVKHFLEVRHVPVTI